MIDLRDRVTAFILTIGDKENFADCLTHLAAQDCQFRQYTITNIAPAAAALQKMIDECETEYCIQVDEDMVLFPHAIRTLYEAIMNGPSRAAIWCYPLWDALIGQAIIGIKIYRVAMMREVKYDIASPSCDIDVNTRLHAAGYEVDCKWTNFFDRSVCLGLHGVHHTPATAYEAYYNRAMKSRLHPGLIGWIHRLPAVFKRIIRTHPQSDVHLYALLGYVAGLYADLTGYVDKDFRYGDPVFSELSRDLERALAPEEMLALFWAPTENQQ
jgi:hypothetical protein